MQRSDIPNSNDTEYQVWTAGKITVEKILDENNTCGQVLANNRADDACRTDDANSSPWPSEVLMQFQADCSAMVLACRMVQQMDETCWSMTLP